MKIQPECVPCLFKRILFEINQSTEEVEKKDAALKAAAYAFSKNYGHNGCSADIATQVHKAVYEALHDDDPYKTLKEISNKIAISLLPKVEKMISTSDDPLKTSLLCSVVGNALDFGIDGGSKHPDVLIDQFSDLLKEGFGFDDTIKIKTLLTHSSHILYFTDNCGEIVFDKLVCRELKQQFPQLTITLIVKDVPILSDATKHDTEVINFSEVVDEILTTGCYAVGLDVNHIPDDLKNRLEKCDLIICKGMANYEVFSETKYHPIAYFMRSKCEPIARSMNVPIHRNIAKLYS
jgi:uncharacterized protein with ATP-grasp and redox domains